MAALVAGIAAAEQRLEALETVSQAQTARAERLDRLAASATAGAPIPSSACAGVVPSPEDQVQEAKVGAAALARGFSAATAAVAPAGSTARQANGAASQLSRCAVLRAPQQGVQASRSEVGMPIGFLCQHDTIVHDAILTFAAMG